MLSQYGLRSPPSSPWPGPRRRRFCRGVGLGWARGATCFLCPLACTTHRKRTALFRNSKHRTRTIFLQFAGFPKAPGSSLKQEAPYRFLHRFGGPSFFNEVGPAQAFLCANDIGRAIRAVLLDNEDSQRPFSYEEVALESPFVRYCCNM